MDYATDGLNSLQLDGVEQNGQKQMLARYLRYWYLFAFGLLLALVGAWLYVRYTTPLYSINSLVLINDRRDNPAQPRPEQFDYAPMQSSAKNIDNEVIMLKSTSLMQRVFAELDLNINYYVKGKIHNQEIDQTTLPFKLIVSKLDSIAFGRAITITPKGNNSFVLEEIGQAPVTHQFGQLIQRPYGQFTVVSSPISNSNKSGKPFIAQFQDIRKAAGDYTKKLNVSPVNKQASILNLNLTDAVPEKGVKILNKLVEVYNKETVEGKNAIAKNTIDFIDERLKYLGSELTDVEKGVENYRRKYQVADVSSQIHQSLSDVSDYTKQAAEYGIQLSVLTSISTYINNPSNQQQLIPSTLSVQDANLSGLITKFNELQLERERILRTVQASNPVVEGMNEQLTNLRANILDNINNIKANLSATQRSLQAKSGVSDSRIQRVPTIERGLEEIKRQQDLKRSLYLYLLQKREEAALSLAATVSSARVVDPAIAGEFPISPQKPAVLVLALMLGLGLPFAFVYVRSALNDKVHSLTEVASATGTPILGELIHNKGKQRVVIGKANRSVIAEMFRLIRTNFQFATSGRPNKVLLVTSSMSGEGKTFFSLNLSASLVLAGKNVIKINLDLRKFDSSTEANALSGLGIADYLTSDTVAIDSIIYQSGEVPGLYCIGTGQLPADPAELLMSDRLYDLLEILKNTFDHIIIDSSPVGQVADAFALAKYIDYTFYLVRYNVTSKGQLDIVKKIRQDKSLLPIGIVINGAKKGNLHDYGYGNGYGYQQEKAKKKIA